eukprot:GHVS01059712.1.p1 GENE.GHVS01059712.1~~GHVS01059712.1.p1  ORF type:complete len:168 (-),score=14.94 GHVS01059712.1:575-1078(-)
MSAGQTPLLAERIPIMSELTAVCKIEPPMNQGESITLIVCGVMNLLIPGIGESVTGCVHSRYMNLTWRGLLQLLLIILIITMPFGIIWAWVDGIIMIIQGLSFTMQPYPAQNVTVGEDRNRRMLLCHGHPTQQASNSHDVQPTAPPPSSGETEVSNYETAYKQDCSV